MKQRLKLLHTTGRIPCIDLDTGKELDWIVKEGSELLLDKEDGSCIIAGEDQLEDAAKWDLMDDPMENAVYFYRWDKVDGRK